MDPRNTGARVPIWFLSATYLFLLSKKEIEMRPEVVEAHSVELREQVFRLRYDVYVGEMRRALPADHAMRRYTDPSDETAVILAAVERDSKRVVGTIRGNWLRNGGMQWYESLYGLSALSDTERRKTSVTTRMMVT